MAGGKARQWAGWPIATARLLSRVSYNCYNLLSAIASPFYVLIPVCIIVVIDITNMKLYH